MFRITSEIIIEAENKSRAKELGYDAFDRWGKGIKEKTEVTQLKKKLKKEKGNAQIKRRMVN